MRCVLFPRVPTLPGLLRSMRRVPGPRVYNITGEGGRGPRDRCHHLHGGTAPPRERSVVLFGCHNDFKRLRDPPGRPKKALRDLQRRPRRRPAGLQTASRRAPGEPKKGPRRRKQAAAKPLKNHSIFNDFRVPDDLGSALERSRDSPREGLSCHRRREWPQEASPEPTWSPMGPPEHPKRSLEGPPQGFKRGPRRAAGGPQTAPESLPAAKTTSHRRRTPEKSPKRPLGGPTRALPGSRGGPTRAPEKLAPRRLHRLLKPSPRRPV